MAERYNTPAEGTLNWHNPLNENFDKLDKHVEIRDREDNRTGYDPVSGSKFLAIDTGAVYIGNGSQWTKLGTVSGSSEGDSDGTSGGGDSNTSGTMADGTLVASPGEVQATLNNAGSDWSFGQGNFRSVTLVSGTTYETTDSIVVPNGVMLDCNGAKIEPQGDFNAIELSPNTTLYRPWVDTRGVSGFSSAAVVVSRKGAGAAATSNPSRVRDAFLFGNRGDGTGLLFRGGEDPCSMQRASGNIMNFQYGVEFKAFGGDTSGYGDWCNGNQFFGAISKSVVPVHLESEGAAVSGNTVFAQVQTHSDTEWIVKQEDDPRSGDRIDKDYRLRGNAFLVYPWDIQNVSNSYERSEDRRAPIWYIGKGYQARNVFYDLSGTISNEHVVNNSDLASRNGAFHGHGGHTTGATQFTKSPAYEPNSNRTNWHPGSRN